MATRTKKTTAPKTTTRSKKKTAPKTTTRSKKKTAPKTTTRSKKKTASKTTTRPKKTQTARRAKKAPAKTEAEAKAQPKTSTTKKTKQETVVIPPLKVGVITIPIVGVSSLMIHQFGSKIQKELEDKYSGKAQHRKRGDKDKEVEFWSCFYGYKDGGKKPTKVYFPGSAFKKAAVRAVSYVDGMNMTFARGAFHVIDTDVLILDLDGKPIKPSMDMCRTDVVRLPNGAPDIRYRPEIKEWAADITFRYNASAISAEQLINLVNVAGFSVGVGELRPEKSGSMGMFEVDTEALGSQVK